MYMPGFTLYCLTSIFKGVLAGKSWKKKSILQFSNFTHILLSKQI